MGKQVINAKIRATIRPQVSGSIQGTISNVVTGQIRGEIGRAAVVPEVFIQHLTDYDNPHKTTASQVGAVPVDFRSFSATETPNKNFRKAAEVFVGNNGKGSRMTLQQVKGMGTKIITVKNIKTADLSDLDVGDYVYSES